MMDLVGYILVGFILYFHLVCGTSGLVLNASQIQDKYCENVEAKSVAATSKIETKAVILNPLTAKDIRLRKTKLSKRILPCDIWTIKSEKLEAEVTVIINDLALFSKDIFFVVSESPRWTLSYDYNLTSDPDLHLFPKTVTSQSPLTLIWFHQSDAEDESPDKRQRLAFSFLTIGGADVETEEKERFVLIGAISISIFTVIATVISIVRSTKCCRCLCAFINISKWESRDRSDTENNSTSMDANGSRTTRQRSGHRDETVLLGEIEVARPTLQSDHLGLLQPVHENDNDDETSFIEGGRSRSNTAPIYYSTDEYESDYDHHLGDTGNRISESRSGDLHISTNQNNNRGPGIDSIDLRPTQTALAAVLGILPATSSVSASSPSSSAFPSNTTSSSFPLSLLPAIRRHLTRTSATIPPSSSSTTPPLALSHTFTHLIQSETRPMFLPSSSSSSLTRPRSSSVGQFHSLGYSRETTHPRHVFPFERNGSPTQTRAMAAPSGSHTEEAPPPPYSETPPPSYSSLFPES